MLEMWIGKDYIELYNSWITIFILILGGIPLIAGGYLYYFWILLIFIFIKIKTVPKDSIFIIVFSICYTYAQIQYSNITFSAIIFFSLYPFILYCTGRYLGSRIQSYKIKTLLIFLIALSFGITSIYYNIVDFMKGNFINFNREVTYGEGSTFRSATGYAMMLSLLVGGIGCLFVNTNSKFDYNLKLVVVITAVIALFLNLRILNRTPVIIAIISIVSAVLMPPQNKKKIHLVLGVITIFLFLYWLFMANNANVNTLIEIFQRRNEEDVSSVSSAGGRDVRWIGAIYQISARPFGSDGLILDGEYTFAHNLWLDAGVKGGIICLICLTFITIRFINVNIRLFKVAPYPQFNRVYWALISITLLSQSAVEPIIEGFPQLLNFLFFYWGFLSSDLKRIKKLK